jgi:hypothetical protein
VSESGILQTRRVRAGLLATAVSAGIALCPAPARADVSSWLFVGNGPSNLHQADFDSRQRWSLQLETGLGTPPGNAVVIGGLGRIQTHFGLGTDLAVLVRTASRSFVTGGWGGAIDLGPYRRFWGIGSTGGSGALVLGAPWGLTLSVGASLGSHDAQTYSAVLGIDFARLTVYRTSGQNFWVNPFPPGRGELSAASR